MASKKEEHMQVKFLYPRIVKGVKYAKGLREVPDAVAQDKYFQILEKAGDLTVISSAATQAKVDPSDDAVKAQAEADAQAKADAEAKAKADAEAKAKADADAAKAKPVPSQPQKKSG